jgi:hypothetical protein
MPTPRRGKRESFKRYTPEEDAIILRCTEGYNINIRNLTSLTSMLNEAVSLLPPENKRSPRGLRDRYYFLRGVRREKAEAIHSKASAPGPKASYTNPIPKEPEDLPFISSIDNHMIPAKPQQHAAVKEPSSFIKPPSLARLMGRR